LRPQVSPIKTINPKLNSNKMSEEQENDGTWSGLKKTIIGTISTAILAGGTYVTTQLFGGGDEEETKTEQVQTAQPVINLNVDNSSQNNSSNGGGGTTTVIKEKTVEKPAAPAPKQEKSESEDAPW
jgi:hypothetical protein